MVTEFPNKYGPIRKHMGSPVILYLHISLCDQATVNICSIFEKSLCRFTATYTFFLLRLVDPDKLSFVGHRSVSPCIV